jgi:hypothetical protein
MAITGFARRNDCEIGMGIEREKTGPLRARFQFVGAGADITFQRGTTADNVRRDLGGWATVHRQ